jgi:hypothetical protein
MRELLVRVPADDERRVDARDRVAQDVVGRRPGQHLVDAPGRAVAEQDAVERVADRPGGDRGLPAGIEGGGAPAGRAARRIVAGGAPGQDGQRLVLGVARDPAHGFGAGGDELERLAWLRPADDVARDDDRIHPRLVDLCEHRA